MLSSLFGWQAVQFLGIGLGYLVALALIVGGGYLAFVLGANPLNPLSKTFHYAGKALMLIGLASGLITYGKSIGAADCMAAWKAKNYEAKIARLEQERDAKNVAADTAAKQAAQLADQNISLQKQVDDYEAHASNSAACRRATDDDDRRLCDITGRSAPGCQHSR